MSNVIGIDFCIYINSEDRGKALAREEQYHAYQRYIKVEEKLADANHHDNLDKVAEEVFHACNEISKDGWFKGERGHAILRLFGYRRRFLVVNYNLSKECKSQAELEAVLSSPEVRSVTEALMSQFQKR
jgi:hypothetical protein